MVRIKHTLTPVQQPFAIFQVGMDRIGLRHVRGARPRGTDKFDGQPKPTKPIFLHEYFTLPFNARNRITQLVFTSPRQFFKLFFNDEIISNITTQTNLYANQHNVRLNMTADELKTVF